MFQTFPWLKDSSLQLHGTMYIFAIVLLISIPIMYLIMPETKGLPLELLQEYFLPSRTIFYSFKRQHSSNRRLSNVLKRLNTPENQFGENVEMPLRQNEGTNQT